jgi:hypothetical protein
MGVQSKQRGGGDPEVQDKAKLENAKSAEERALEQGLEESMNGSDPVSVTQPSPSKHDVNKP